MSKKRCANKPIENSNEGQMFKREKLEFNSFTRDRRKTFARVTLDTNPVHAYYRVSAGFVTYILLEARLLFNIFQKNPVSHLCKGIGGLVQ